MMIYLSVTQPYNWSMVHAFLTRRAIAGIEECGEFHYARYFDETDFYAVSGLSHVSNEGLTSSWFCATYEPEAQRFAVQLSLHNEACREAVLANIARVLDAQQDPNTIAQALTKAGFTPEHMTSGLRLPATWSPFEALIRAIVGQQISVNGAVKILNQWIGNLRAEANGYRHFPSATEIACCDTSKLPMPKARQATLNLAAETVQAKPLHDSETIQDLLKIKGIGPWTVNYVLMRGISHPDIFLDNDLVVKNQLARFALTPELAKPWRSYVCIQLWEHANT
ncbi:AlkA N-terminal domain-containing protein [Glaciecola sp. HTCC2999]|jgi:AraC family transcriptional regulator of adaptative response / DNA-3-methyladenine glycosylase II|uniref:AlkA N-terminal domain-containing protein n=1 Tax=Glaciecola sp. HTCC2999 TaxID=455436 RepID=UPI0000E0EED3|nr:AlkA N-terminal domain-containing protein [Glaciecola sp. HTCC2999]